MKTVSFVILTAFFNFEKVFTLNFLQHPTTQHVLIGNDTAFSCVVSRVAEIHWYAYFPDDAFNRVLDSRTEDVIRISTVPSGDIVNTTITINAQQNWNNTILRCFAVQGSGLLSNPAFLMIYTSLRPLPPSSLQIASINSSTLRVNWIPMFLWEDYPIDYYSITIIGNHRGLFNRSISARVESSEHHYTFSDFSLLSCSEYNFSVAAVNEMYGKSDRVKINGNLGSGLSGELNVDAAVYFQSDGSPIVEVKFQLPSSICSFEYLSINYTVIGMDKTVVSGTLAHQGVGNVTFSIMSGLLVDHNYTLMILIISSSGDLNNVISSSVPFDTMLLLSNLFSCSDKKDNESKDTVYYKMAIGICLNVALMMFIVSAIVIVCVCAHKMKIICTDKRLYGSSSRVCNAMVHNPIYDGPVYESVQNQLATFKSTEEQAAGISDNSVCSTQSSTHITTSDNTVRYADPPVKISKIRSNSFVCGIPPHSSTPSSDADNVPRSTTVSIPAQKKNAKERNILHLTLALTGNDLNMNDEPQFSQNYNPLPIGGEANHVDEDDNYTVMSPAVVTSNSGKVDGVS